MWAIIPCCGKKKSKPSKSRNISVVVENPTLTNQNVPLDTMPQSTKENMEKPLIPVYKGPVESLPLFEGNSGWKADNENRIKRASQESLFNLTGDYEVQKRPAVNGEAEDLKKHANEHDEMNNSFSLGNSIYQLTKELNVPGTNRNGRVKDKMLLANQVNGEGLNLEGDENEDHEEHVKQISKNIQENNMVGLAASLSNIKTRKLKPLSSNTARPMVGKIVDRKNVFGTKENLAFERPAKTTDRVRARQHSKSNLKGATILTMNQTSIQQLSRMQKSKAHKSSTSQASKRVRKVVAGAEDLAAQSVEEYSVESNFPGKANYDTVLNKNLIVNNMILDDSILEAQGISSLGKMIIAESSRIDEHSFPPWQKQIHEDNKFYQSPKKAWDDDKFNYDADKLKECYEMDVSIKRIKDCEGAKLWGEVCQVDPAVFQGRSLTCSLVSALNSIMEFEQAKKFKFIENTIFPQQNNKPILSQSGKYGIKLFLNGTKRFVEIDDKIVFRQKPQSKENMLLGARTKDLNDYWPALVEKAISKVYTATDMVLHTIPSVECYRLTGWVPEIIRVVDIPNSDHLWQRLYQNAEEDNILVSLGTRGYDPDVDKDVVQYQKGLYRDKKTDVILDHAYSVLALAEVADLKILKVRNPWGHSHTRIFKPTQFEEQTTLVIYDSLNTSENELNKDGVSIILWDDIVKFCSTVYLNWSPAVYPYRQTKHSRREIPMVLYNPESKIWREEYSLEYSPQFLLKIPPHEEDFEVRILFERHVDSLKKDNFYSLRYHLFSYRGDRVVFPHEALRSQAWNAREVLSDVFIFEASKEVEVYTLVLLSTPTTKKNKYSIKDQTYNFTFEVFSFIEIEIIELPFRKIKQRELIEGRYNNSNAGGNILSPNFLENPKYILSLKEKEDLHIKAEGPNESSLMILAIPTGGLDLKKEPLPRVDFQNFVTYNPGFYFEGFSSYKLTLPPDNYMILLSNQNYKLGNYRIYIDSLSTQLSYHKTDLDNSNPPNTFSIKEYEEIKEEHRLEVYGEWNEQNSKGVNRSQSQDFQVYMKNPGFILSPQKTTNVRFILQSETYTKLFNEALETDPENGLNLEPPSASVAVFEILDNLKFRLILEDERYAPCAWGFYSKEITLTPCKNGYLIVCSNYEKGYLGKFKLTVLSNIKIETIQTSANLNPLKESSNVLKGVWSKNTAGGSSSELTFYANPSYELIPSADCEVNIELACSEPHPLSISLFESGGKRLTEFDLEAMSQIVTNPNATPDVAYLRKKLKGGKVYLLIPSTSKPSQLGKYELRVEASAKVDIQEKKPINYKNKNTYSGEWGPNTNMGSFGKPTFLNNPSLTFKVLEPTKFRIHLYTAGSASSIAIHLYEIKEETKLSLIKSSGHYTTVRMGAFIEGDIKPNKNGYMFVVSTYESAKNGEFFVELASLKINDIQVNQLSNLAIDE